MRFYQRTRTSNRTQNNEAYELIDTNLSKYSMKAERNEWKTSTQYWDFYLLVLAPSIENQMNFDLLSI